MKLPVVLTLFGAFELCATGRILFLVAIPSRSHFILTEHLVEELGERGHEVIVITPFRRLKPVENVAEIVIPDVSDVLLEKTGNVSDKFQMSHKMYSTSSAAEVLVDRIMSHQPVIDFLNTEQDIDLVVGISASVEGLLAGFSHRFNAPMVSISTSVPSTPHNQMVGNPAPSAYVPDGSSGYTDRMNFCQRFVNFFHEIFSEAMFYWLYLPRQDHLMRKYFGKNVPPLKELLFNNSLVLVNHHFGFGFPRPYLPNMIEIGGYHVRPAKALPKDLEDFMDEAADGVIYFNMGSSLKSAKLTKEKFEGILKSFSNLTQRVLWKFETENAEDLPDNVRISKWLPQSDILAHPNLKLFITHGGLLSITESIYRGVPIVGIPIYPDQIINLKHIENLNLGIKLDFDAITEETMSSAVQQILNNTMYRNNAKIRSEILQDRPLHPMDTALYWLEYIMRHKGAPHLRSGAQNLSWHQLHLLDVFLLLGVVLFSTVFVLHKFSCWIFRILRESRMEDKLFLKKAN